MKNKEAIERNIGLTFDFIKYLINNPDVTETFPKNFTLEFIEKDFPNFEKNKRKLKPKGIKNSSECVTRLNFQNNKVDACFFSHPLQELLPSS